MITTQGVVEWLTPMIANLYVVAGPRIPDMPDQAVIVTRVAGAPSVHEGAFVRPAFQCRVRGPVNQPDATERLATTLMTKVLDTSCQTLVGDRQLIDVQVLGSLAPFPGTPDSGGRVEYVVTFILTVASEQNE